MRDPGLASRRVVLLAGLATLLSCRRGATSRASPSLGARASARRIALPAGLGVPQQIVPSGRGRAWVVGSGFAVAVDGDDVHTIGADVHGTALGARRDHALLLGGGLYDRAGRLQRKLAGGGLYHDAGVDEQVLHVDDHGWTTVAALAGRARPATMFVQRRAWRGDGAAARQSVAVDGRGVGARRDDGEVVLAFDEGRVVGLASASAGVDPIPVSFETTVAPRPYAITGDDDGVTLLCADAGRGRWARGYDDGLPTPVWTTTVVQLDRRGRERARVVVPFAAERVLVWPRGGALVVGRGLACVAAGALAWVHDDGRDRMAAIVDDACVVAAGDALERCDRRGRVIDRLALAQAPSCPPALDGRRVWLAGPGALWCTS